MLLFEHIIGNIYRLKVPFFSVYTSVFAITHENATILFDSGSNESDVAEIILPALKMAGFVPTHLAISHYHDDHSGGVTTLAKAFPSAEICAFGEELGEVYPALNYRRFADGEEFCDGVEFWNLKGHTRDCGAIFDKRSKTLLSVDCLQLCGIGKYGCGVMFGDDYLKSLDRILKTNTENIIASHEYVPLGSSAFGRKEAENYVNYCRDYFLRLADFAHSNQGFAPCELATLYNKDSGLPTVPESTFKNFC